MNIKHIVFHKPGPNWKEGIGFREQPSVIEHVQHYAKLHESGQLYKGGPFTDADSGGMMIADQSMSRDALEKFASEDPAVIGGLLTFEVKSWYIAMEQP
ncbi:MAG: hypothetical protein AAF490_14375 [Chloroflexota bacterium]